MISEGELYDWSDELKYADHDRCREMCRELLDEVHRLRSLISEMADFRASKEHQALMKSLDDLNKKL